jgi:hypothetical protein
MVAAPKKKRARKSQKEKTEHANKVKEKHSVTSLPQTLFNVDAPDIFDGVFGKPSQPAYACEEQIRQMTSMMIEKYKNSSRQGATSGERSAASRARSEVKAPPRSLGVSPMTKALNKEMNVRNKKRTKLLLLHHLIILHTQPRTNTPSTTTPDTSTLTTIATTHLQREDGRYTSSDLTANRLTTMLQTFAAGVDKNTETVREVYPDANDHPYKFWTGKTGPKEWTRWFREALLVKCDLPECFVCDAFSKERDEERAKEVNTSTQSSESGDTGVICVCVYIY